MAVFSVDEVRQIVVANSYEAWTPPGTGEQTPGSYNGLLLLDPNPPYIDGPAFRVRFGNADGQAVASDIIRIGKPLLQYARALPHAPTLPRIDVVTLSPDVLDATTVVDGLIGQSLSIKFLMREWGSGSAEDQQYFYINTKVVSGDTAETIFTRLADLATNTFNQSGIQYFDFTVVGTGNAATLQITELPQPWVQNKRRGRPLNYDIFFVAIDFDGTDNYVQWATYETTQQADPGMGTARLARDIETFSMRERGDIYGQVGFPYTWDTEYLTSGTYDVIELKYQYQDAAVFPQFSEKQLIILASAPDGTVDTAATDHTIANQIIADINAAVGSTIIPTL